MKRIAAAIAVFLLVCLAHSEAGTVTIKGSDTMVRLAQRWAEVYMKTHRDAVVQVTGGGTGTGIAALLNGGTDVCQASRDMQGREYQLATRKGKDPYRTVVALDAVAVYVHPLNPIDTLTFDQLKSIFTGEITNWSELGGSDHRIIMYGRGNNSGTYMFFREHVMDNRDYAVETQMLPGTSAVVSAIAQDRYGIGYGGIAWEKGVKHVWVKTSHDDPAIEPTLDNVANGEYPIARELFWFTNGRPAPDVAAMVDWVLSEAGQSVAREAGYYPVSAETAAKGMVK